MVIACIVQARMGSTRLPGKAMADICGQTALARVLHRCDRIPGIDMVVLAAPDTAENNCLGEVARVCGAHVFRGSEHDVLARYVGAATAFKADVAMRVTADCPLIDPEICGEVLAAFKSADVDYAGNAHPRTVPSGLDCEVFSVKALRECERIGRLGREHVTTQLAEAGLVGAINTEHGIYAHRMERWTLDYPEDLEFIRAVYAVREPRRARDVLDILNANPSIRTINACRTAA